MKTLTLILLALSMAACASHPTTEMDRELALKLADKTPVVVTAPAPVINVNNYNGGGQAGDYASNLSHDNIRPEAIAEAAAAQQNCSYIPQYDLNGQFLSTIRKCFGSK